ncbi:MAG: hypothetical protein V9H69_07610 [Anaerolineae bacterium]
MEIATQAELLDRMGLGDEAVVVVHVGGVYESHEQARALRPRRSSSLPEPARRRLALENDDTRFGVADTPWIHERTGVRLIFDNLHHHNFNPERRPLREALAALPGHLAGRGATQGRISARPARRCASQNRPTRRPAAVSPSFCSRRSGRATPTTSTRSSSSPFCARPAGLRPFDVMLEAKAKDLALLRLREDSWPAPRRRSWQEAIT